jgi:hypothetical protein
MQLKLSSPRSECRWAIFTQSGSTLCEEAGMRQRVSTLLAILIGVIILFLAVLFAFLQSS